MGKLSCSFVNVFRLGALAAVATEQLGLSSSNMHKGFFASLLVFLSLLLSQLKHTNFYILAQNQ